MLTLLLACTHESKDHRAPPPVTELPAPTTTSLPGSSPVPGSVPSGSSVATGSTGSTVPDPPTDFPTESGEPIPLCINEFMPDTMVSTLDEDGTPADWIELHNPSAAAVSLAGWSITDDPAVPDQHLFDPTLSVDAGGFLLLWADDLPELGPTHLAFALSDEGDAVALFDAVGNGSIVWFGAVGNDLAVARSTDCCTEADGCWSFLFAGTPGASNEAVDTGP